MYLHINSLLCYARTLGWVQPMESTVRSLEEGRRVRPSYSILSSLGVGHGLAVSHHQSSLFLSGHPLSPHISVSRFWQIYQLLLFRGNLLLPLPAHRVPQDPLLFSIISTHLFKQIILKHFSKNSVPICHQLPAQNPAHCRIKEIIAQKVLYVGNGHLNSGHFLNMTRKIFSIWGIALPSIVFCTFGYCDPFFSLLNLEICLNETH